MTTATVQPRPVTHRTKPWLGTGTAFRWHGNTSATVQWPGVPLTRNESVEDLVPAAFPHAWPLPAVRTRRAR